MFRNYFSKKNLASLGAREALVRTWDDQKPESSWSGPYVRALTEARAYSLALQQAALISLLENITEPGDVRDDALLRLELQCSNDLQLIGTEYWGQPQYEEYEAQY